MNSHKKLYVVLLFLVTQTNITYTLGEAVPYALLKKILPANPIIIEAGAQFGEDTQWMSAFWPQGTIYAFEPSPVSFPSVQDVAANNNNVFAQQLALSNIKGEFAFYLAGGASSLLKPTESFNNDYFHSDLEHPIIVPVTTLDEWAYDHNISTIDFMWLDMEGNELNALQGALNSLKNVKLIYTEVNLQRFWENCVMYDELTAWMNEHGFIEIWSDIQPHWHGNVLFMNTNL
jgi:FkbM family methyltransferase